MSSAFKAYAVNAGLEQLRHDIRAELSSDSIAAVAGSTIACVDSSPLLALCRKLVDIGYPSSADLDCYRGETLSLRIRAIGQAAGLEINSGGSGFTSRPTPRPATPACPSSVEASS